jgi:hypothetical protein
MRVSRAAIAAVVMTCASATAEPEPEPTEAEPIEIGAEVTETVRRNPLSWSDLHLSTHCPLRRDLDRELGLEVSVGGIWGWFRAGPVRGSAFGFHATAGVQRDDWALLADYTLVDFTETTKTDGRDAVIHRAGAAARYSLLSVRERYPTMRADLWLEAGVGREWLRWYDGGQLARTDARLAVGGQGTIRFGHHDRHKVGVFVALALVVAPAPGGKMLAPGCAGPCDTPTRRAPYDLMYWIDVGFPFR